MGGGVDFGETSRDALQREFQEEIQAELTNIRHLGCLENLFTLTVSRVTKSLVYQCDFVDSKFYQLEQLVLLKVSEKKRHFVKPLHIWGIEVPEQFLVC